MARITQIFKSGGSADPSNYRPISSLHFLSKVIEKIFSNRLTCFFDKFSLFTASQFGFRKFCSTVHALTDLTNGIYSSLDSKNHHINVFIDLKKAFDTVPHQVLLSKLALYGVRGVPLKFIKSFLADRSQFVRMGEYSSSLKAITMGVPQGSILGPILFIIFINDFPAASNLLNCLLFADDSSFSISGDNLGITIPVLNEELRKVAAWTLANRLTINTGKTQMLLYSNKFVDFNSQEDVLFNGSPIEFSDSCSYLGVLIDNKLVFRNHIDRVVSKISKNTGILYKIRDFLPREARLSYYYSFILPYLTYNVLVWGSTYPVHLNSLIIQHKRTIRTLAGVPYGHHTTGLFYEYKLLKFVDLYKYHVCLYMFSARNKYAVSHNLSTRSNNLPVSMFFRTTLGQHSINFMGPKIWNSLPESVRNVDTLNRFKSEVKNYYLSFYIAN